MLCSFSKVVDIQRPIWEFEGLVDPILTQHIISLLSKARHIQLYLFLVNPLLLVNPLHPVDPIHLVNPFQPVNLPIVAELFLLNVQGHQLEQHLVRLLFHSCMVFLLTHCF